MRIAYCVLRILRRNTPDLVLWTQMRIPYSVNSVFRRNTPDLVGSNAYSVFRIAYSEEEYARSCGLKCVFRIPYSVF